MGRTKRISAVRIERYELPSGVRVTVVQAVVVETDRRADVIDAEVAGFGPSSSPVRRAA